jgi:flavin-dependent dehydrogenase
VWDGRRRFSRGGILVAGDAAGLVNPLTGAGIRRACISGQLAAEAVHAYLAGGGRCVKDLGSYDRRVVADLVDELKRARLFGQLFYRAPAFFYRIGVMNARVNPWVGELLSGQKSYLEVFSELVSGEWMRR